MASETSLISIGDFLDVYYKVKQKGVKQLLSLLKLSNNNRVAEKWNNHQQSSDYWIIPQLQQHWNSLISGNPKETYEFYVSKSYLANKSNLSLLSIGCGEGLHERHFAQSGQFSKVIGVDISPKRIEKAQQLANEQKLSIEYIAGDFHTMNLPKASFDVILFDSSLHHFSDLNTFLKNEIEPLLKEEGFLVINEYCGPNRLQWTKAQLNYANELLQEIPKKHKILVDGTSVKRKVYRPGLLRMFLVDPSEAPDSANLQQALHTHFSILEEKQMGCNILHILLKGIAHHFVQTDAEKTALLSDLIAKEKEFVNRVGKSDSIFGVYQKKTTI